MVIVLRVATMVGLTVGFSGGATGILRNGETTE